MNNQISSRATRKPILKPYGLHLIYAEGKKTEPYYIDNLNSHLKKNDIYRRSQILIKTIPSSGGRNTISLCNYAEKDVLNRLEKGEVINHVWIFYDKDDFPQTKFDDTYNIIKSKNNLLNEDNDECDENGICWHPIWSNECFELWILLHFQNINSNITRQECYKKLEEIPQLINAKDFYRKNRHDLFDYLNKYGSLKNAIKNAKRIDPKTNSKSNPSTGVYLFIEYFIRYLDLNNL